MTQSPAQPPPPLPAPPHSSGGGVSRGDVQVRCAGCRVILRVKTGVVEFSCPTCQLPQMLPPELLSRARTQPPPPIQSLPPPPLPPQQLKPMSLQPRPPVPAHGIDPTKMQLPCANCQAILNVPHGLTRFSCPQCHVELAVDVSKLNRSLTAPQATSSAPPSVPPPPPPEEVNEVYAHFISQFIPISSLFVDTVLELCYRLHVVVGCCMFGLINVEIISLYVSELASLYCWSKTKKLLKLRGKKMKEENSNA